MASCREKEGPKEEIERNGKAIKGSKEVRGIERTEEKEGRKQNRSNTKLNKEEAEFL